jgi:hypothetical protein
MQETAKELGKILLSAGSLLTLIEEEDASLKPAPDKWSKKEILGHLIDSACNNQQKFVRAMAEKHVDFVGYQQRRWVESQKYNARFWQELFVFWTLYNTHLIHLIENVAPEVLANEITIDGAGPFTLEFIMKDYVEHLKHHLKQILPDADLDSNFENIYNT